MFELAQRYGVLEGGQFAVLKVSVHRIKDAFTFGNEFKVEQGIPKEANIYRIHQEWIGPFPYIFIVLKSPEFPYIPPSSPLPLLEVKIKKKSKKKKEEEG